ncbi:MAG: hypothetical protein KA258_01665 [Deltaproteobacteria bacterium]|nr:hypothetical protein [Deltaproteobacteria bacterium]
MRTSSRLGVLSSFSRLLVGLTLAISVLGGCREMDDGFPDLRDAGLDAQTDAAIRDGAGLADLSWRTDLGWPAPMPPPASCNQRYPDVTGIQVVLRVDQYKGVRDGRNGPHEIVHGTIINTPWVYKAAIVDTTNVEVAMNIQTATDLTGLPMEIPVKPRDLIEVAGEYIPKSKASASTALGPAAVIHFTHHHCGYVVIEGIKYK